MLKRLNKACKFFPCHKELEDCTFCYCPFYPCLDAKRGEYVYSSKDSTKIWSCMSCDWIHKRKVVDGIFDLIRENKFRRQKLRDVKAGIIVLSHGSKLPQANAGLGTIVRVIKKDTGLKSIFPAYLQFGQPDLRRAIEDLLGRGYRKIIIVPFFLFNGNHVTRDIPRIIGEMKADFPEVKFVYTKSLGEDRRVAGIVSDILRKVLV